MSLSEARIDLNGTTIMFHEQLDQFIPSHKTLKWSIEMSNEMQPISRIVLKLFFWKRW